MNIFQLFVFENFLFFSVNVGRGRLETLQFWGLGLNSSRYTINVGRGDVDSVTSLMTLAIQ